MFFLFGYVDNMVFDPFFFGPIHGSYANPDILAWKALLNDKLGGMHNVSGFEGNNGFLQSNFMQAILKPYKDNLDIADGYELADTGQDANAIAPMASGELPPLQLAPA